MSLPGVEMFDCPRCAGHGALPGWSCCGLGGPHGCCGDPEPCDQPCPWCHGAGILRSAELIERAASAGDAQTLAAHEAALMIRETLAHLSPKTTRRL
jgi:hypothetical protein